MDELVQRMADLGAPDPTEWARSEIDEGFAQQARYLFLRSIWPSLINPYADEDSLRSIPAAGRLLDAGASVSDLALALRAVAYATAFGVVYRIDEGYDVDAPEDAPGWVLMEVQDNSLTGRPVAGLHEDLLRLDPTGLEGSDLW